MKKRRLLSIVLSLCMVLALVPQMVFAEGEISGTPSVTAYATKEQLKDGTFAPNANGTANNIGKLVFGKKSDGTTPQEWYILGKDDGVTGDNTIIFASDPMGSNSKFNSDTSDKTYNYSAGTGYGDTDGSIEVYANHYGASDLRAALQGMETSNFTEAEQNLMNDTTVTTNDTMNSTTYTTTDKLYALAADGMGQSYTTIKAGSRDQTVLSESQYLNNEKEFFLLRSPHTEESDAVLLARPNSPYGFIGYTGVDESFPVVRPAANLNLSKVLFASAAKATSSGTIADGTAMTLRLDGSSKNIGAVAYRTATGDIFATKGSTTGDVALVVQGNDGTNDWYYSKQITGTETEIVNISDIKTELGLSADIDLLTAKIWLETTDATDGMIYAVDPIRSDKLISITSPDSITVDNGTAYEDMNLPETVEVETALNSVTKLPVVWDTDNPKEGSYDPSIKTEQTVTLFGFLQLPDAFEHNSDGPATTTITITIKAAPGTSD
ncbi:MAG: DUF6273 domain-containing protein, partial [Eubacteriaceae bacterium]|nr:DUF6273 domain-containing protein [Eubacteriaceae bacterium]